MPKVVEDIAIVRIEQLYPFPEDDLIEVLAPYNNLKHAVWCQEEPMNQGAWHCKPAPHAPYHRAPQQVACTGVRRP